MKNYNNRSGSIKTRSSYIIKLQQIEIGPAMSGPSGRVLRLCIVYICMIRIFYIIIGRVRYNTFKIGASMLKQIVHTQPGRVI